MDDRHYWGRTVPSGSCTWMGREWGSREAMSKLEEHYRQTRQKLTFPGWNFFRVKWINGTEEGKKRQGGQREMERAYGERFRLRMSDWLNEWGQPRPLQWGRGNTNLSPTSLISSQMEAGHSQNVLFLFFRIAWKAQGGWWMGWSEGRKLWGFFSVEGTMSGDEDSEVRGWGQECGAGIKVQRVPRPQQRHC